MARFRLYAALLSSLALAGGCATAQTKVSTDTADVERLDTLTEMRWFHTLTPPSAAAGTPQAAIDAAQAGRLAMERGNYRAAMDAFAKAFKLAPKSRLYEVELACAKGWVGAADRAEQTLVAVVAKLEGTNDARQSFTRVMAEVCLINSRVALGRVASLDRAARSARDLAARFPMVIDVHYARGRAHLAQGQRREARDAFYEIRNAAPGHRGVNLGLLAALSAEPDSRDFEVIAARVKKRWPADPDALVILGTAAETGGRIDEALALYRRALSVEVEHPVANFNLARLTEERQGLDAARPLYERYIKHASSAHRVRVQRLKRRLARPTKD